MALSTHLVLARSHPRFTLHFLSLMIILVFCIILHNKQVLADDDVKDECQFDKYSGTDKTELEAAKQRIRSLVGHTYTSHDGNNYEFTVGICTKLTDTGLDGDIAVVQVELDENGKPGKSHNLGSLKNTHIMVGSDWVMLDYKDGEEYNSHCGGERKRSTIMITCDENIDDADAKMVFIKEEASKVEACYYLFEMKHKAVCPVAGSQGLSVGSILVIVFFAVLAVYLIVGFLYQRFVLGSKGIEQIPNYEFWKDFGNLQADGCDFICRSKGRQRSGHLGGLGDDQLDPAEEVRDDNLLPM